MISSHKVFIYDGGGESPASAMDLKELFTSTKIFSSKPDVTFAYEIFNPEGLKTLTYVLPGGVSAMGQSLVNLQLTQRVVLFCLALILKHV